MMACIADEYSSTMKVVDLDSYYESSVFGVGQFGIVYSPVLSDRPYTGNNSDQQ